MPSTGILIASTQLPTPAHHSHKKSPSRAYYMQIEFFNTKLAIQTWFSAILTVLQLFLFALFSWLYLSSGQIFGFLVLTGWLSLIFLLPRSHVDVRLFMPIVGITFLLEKINRFSLAAVLEPDFAHEKNIFHPWILLQTFLAAIYISTLVFRHQSTRATKKIQVMCYFNLVIGFFWHFFVGALHTILQFSLFTGDFQILGIICASIPVYITYTVSDARYRKLWGSFIFFWILCGFKNLYFIEAFILLILTTLGNFESAWKISEIANPLQYFLALTPAYLFLLAGTKLFHLLPC